MHNIIIRLIYILISIHDELSSSYSLHYLHILPLLPHLLSLLPHLFSLLPPSPPSITPCSPFYYPLLLPLLPPFPHFINPISSYLYPHHLIPLTSLPLPSYYSPSLYSPCLCRVQVINLIRDLQIERGLSEMHYNLNRPNSLSKLRLQYKVKNSVTHIYKYY